MRILLTNDDGVYASGLRALRKELMRLGDVTVDRPGLEQSGVGHSITLLEPAGRQAGRRRRRQAAGHVVEGSPADCVKLAVYELMDRPPDLIVSGINHGANAGINVLYSGTVAAAIEGAFFDITSIAVSLELSEHFDFPYAARHAAGSSRRILANNPPARLAVQRESAVARRAASRRGSRSCRWASAATARGSSSAATPAAGPTTG